MKFENKWIILILVLILGIVAYRYIYYIPHKDSEKKIIWKLKQVCIAEAMKNYQKEWYAKCEQMGQGNINCWLLPSSYKIIDERLKDEKNFCLKKYD